MLLKQLLDVQLVFPVEPVITTVCSRIIYADRLAHLMTTCCHTVCLHTRPPGLHLIDYFLVIVS